MVEASVADIVCPAVAAYDPDAPTDQVIDNGKKVAGSIVAIGEFD
jgi:hypothetical protein